MKEVTVNGKRLLVDESGKVFLPPREPKEIGNAIHTETGERVFSFRYGQQGTQTMKQVKRVIYEAFHGPLKRHEAVGFKDGNPLNCSKDNLYIVNQ